MFCHFKYDDLYTRGLRFCPIESCRCIDSRASAICLYIKIDMQLKFDGTESETSGVPKVTMVEVLATLVLLSMIMNVYYIKEI